MFELTTSSKIPSRSGPSFSRRNGRSDYWRSILVFLFLCLTRIIGLTRQSLWFDEGYTFNLASSPDFSSFLKTFAGYTTSEHLQPVYYFFMFLWSRFAGTSDIALRLPSALFSATSCYAVFDLCLRLPRVRRSSFSLLTCVAIAISSFSVYYAQEARPYALLQALSLWLLNLWIRRKYLARDTGTFQRNGVGFVLLCGLCVLGSAFTALLVFSLALTDWIADRSISIWLRGWAIPIGFSALALGGYLWIGLHIFPGFVAQDVTSIKQPLWMNVGYTIYGVLFGTTVGPSNALLRGSNKVHLLLSFWPIMLLSALAFFAIAVGTTYILRAGPNIPAATRPVALATGIYFLTFFLIFGLAGHLNILPRHASSLFSLLFVLALLCATAVESPYRPPGFAWMSFGITTWFAINIVSLYGYHFDPVFRKDDYRVATEVIRSSEGVPVFMVEGQPKLIEHYGASVIDASDVAPRKLSEFLLRRSEYAPEIQLVVNEYRGFRWDHSPSPVSVLAPNYACALDRHLTYIDVFDCRLKTLMLISGGSYRSSGTRSGPTYAR